MKKRYACIRRFVYKIATAASCHYVSFQNGNWMILQTRSWSPIIESNPQHKERCHEGQRGNLTELLRVVKLFDQCAFL